MAIPTGFSGGSPFQRFSANGTQGVIPPGEIVTPGMAGIYGGVSVVTDSSNSSQHEFAIDWAAPFGAVPTDYSVYYMFQNGSSPICQSGGQGAQTCTQVYTTPATLNESSMEFLGNMSGYFQLFSPPKLPSNITADSGFVNVGLFSPNGTLITQDSYPVVYIYSQVQAITPYQGSSLVVSSSKGSSVSSFHSSP